MHAKRKGADAENDEDDDTVSLTFFPVHTHALLCHRPILSPYRDGGSAARNSFPLSIPSLPHVLHPYHKRSFFVFSFYHGVSVQLTVIFCLPQKSRSSKRSRPAISITSSVRSIHSCSACDACFDSRQSLRRHGRGPTTNEACRAAVEYGFE
jgi:hypothetical protein